MLQIAGQQRLFKILVLGIVDTYKSKVIRLLENGVLDDTFTMASSLYFHQNKKGEHCSPFLYSNRSI